jgi:hypothetical protein
MNLCERRVQRVLDGIRILQRYDPMADLGAEHDAILFSHLEPEHITAADIEILNELGWYYGGDFYCWYHNV